MKVQADFVQVPKPFGSNDEGSSSTSTLTSSTAAKPNDLSSLKILSKINDSRFPVFLAYSPEHQKKCALKLFPYLEAGVNPAYANEARFSTLRHENIINVLGTIDKQRSTSGNVKFNASCVLMEYAPFGDFVDIISSKRFHKDETLARTYFRQLIEGIEYLHSQGISHMDIKLENLLLGEDYKLKITDFDLSYVEGDITIRGKGTRNYRPPELRSKHCNNTKATDIYAAGIILFSFKTSGFPCMEDCTFEGSDLYSMMLEGDKEFWAIHNKVQKRRINFDEDFKELFSSMVRADPNERATIEQIKNSKWYQGPVYSEEECKRKLKELKLLEKKNASE